MGQPWPFQYAAAGQLKDDQTGEYRYDDAGNKQRGATLIAPGNRLLKDSVAKYTYDAEGNCTSRTAVVGGQVWVYRYDNGNRLVEADLYGSILSQALGQATTRVFYRYDALGNLRERRVLQVDAGTTVTQRYTSGHSQIFWALRQQDLPIFSWFRPYLGVGVNGGVECSTA